jgi:hypothetical protein
MSTVSWPQLSNPPEVLNVNSILTPIISPFLQVYKELSNPPEVVDVNSILTPQELALQQKLQTLDMQYYRVPLHHDTTPSEQVSLLIIYRASSSIQDD